MTHPHFAATISDTHGRYDIYGFIHKALRKAQCEMLVRLGNTDFGGDIAPLLGDLRALLELGASHINHEEAHIHPVLERRARGATVSLEVQHDSHRDDFRQLAELIDDLECAAAPHRPALGRRLYLAYSLFIAHDFEHMFDEQTANNARLWDVCDDGELHAMEGAIVASLPPHKVMYTLRLMVPALSRDERVQLLAGMKARAPHEAFMAVMDVAARGTLTADDFADLEQRLGLQPAVPA